MKIGIVQRASSHLGLLGGRQMVAEAVVAEFNVAEKRWMARCLHPKCDIFPVIPFWNFEPWISGRRPPGFFFRLGSFDPSYFSPRKEMKLH